MTTVKKQLCVTGDGSIDSFSFMWCFCNNEPLGNRVPGGKVDFSSTVQVDSSLPLVEFSVHSCTDDYDSQRRLFYRGTDVFLLCYNVSSPKSLDNAELRHLPEIQRFCPKVPVVLVATCIEFRHNQFTLNELAKTNEEPVTMETGQAVADRLGVFAYMECSENTGQGMKELQRTAALAALSHTPTAETRSDCCCIL